MPVRFHLDENIDPDLGLGLRARGIEVTISRELSMLGTTDAEQLAFINSTRSVLVTHDADFLRIAATGAAHPGIVFSVAKSHSLGEQIRRIVTLWRTRSAEDFVNQVVYL
jgi:predicted nuclease of predicted toxin-antitoxin system